jgi:outer membrane protein OmpA-like peptidoglycan-associated protein
MIARLLILTSGTMLSCTGSQAVGMALAPDAEAATLQTGPILAPVNFDSGSIEIKPPELLQIYMAAGVLKGGDWKVMLVGLSDASGDAAANKKLTEQRCDAVAAELFKLSIPHSRIVQHPIGERLATDPNNVRQRKVEFVFYTGGSGMSPKDIAVQSRVLEPDYHRQEEAR